MSKQNSSMQDITCTEKCRSKQHGKNITSAITKRCMTDYQLACYIKSTCRNYAQVVDDEGRSALHMAASCGRRDLCWWLLKAGRAELNLKDVESGYTPLHRSIFYGHINNAVFLIEMGAQAQMMDKEDLQASDHAMKDRLCKQFSVNNSCQAYVWGTNNNYTLGTVNQQSRQQPEPLDFFRKNNISIKKVAMDKFHSVFVSSTGRAWACGHGQGGRLGLESEQTVLKPQPIKTGAEIVVSASIGRNHTILLMESGAVWTCGSNVHHVLGHSPPPPALLAPRPIQLRLVKVGRPIVGVAAARFHSVIWTDSAVFTFGLNAGQLGHPQLQDKTIVIPKQVPGLSMSEDCKILDVASSVGATVVSIDKRDLYLLHNYQIRRIASRMMKFNVTKVTVYGGELNSELDPKLTFKGGEELRVMVLTSTGQILLWQESFPQLTRCVHPSKRSLTFCEIFLCSSSALLVTNDGEAYSGHLKPKVKKKVVAPSPKSENMSFIQFIEKQDCHHMSIRRIPHIHRAVSMSADPKGLNFVVIQEHPNANFTDIPEIGDSEFPQQMASLFNDAHEEDSLHDILIQLDTGSVPAHHFILACASEEFANMPLSKGVRTLQLKGVDKEVLNQVLSFVYTRDCDVIHPGPFQPRSFKGDIIKATYAVAKTLKISVLMKCLQLLRYEEGLIVLKDGEVDSLRGLLREHAVYDRSMWKTLYDVCVKSSDGATFKAHKCILAARLEYFNNMFTGGWVEAEATTNLSLPIPQTILLEVLDFLYKDEAPLLANSQDVDYISSVLVVADQLFIKRLKQTCEVALSGNLSLRNCAYLLQLAFTYNADQLKSSCMQFISLNLAALLETRSLEILDNKTLEELSEYYRNMIPAMSKRIVTPFSTAASEDDMIDIANSNSVAWIDSEDLVIDTELLTATKVNRSSPMPITGKRKSPRYRKSSESQRRRFESVSSNSDLDCSFDLTPPGKIDFDDLVELKQTNKPEEQVKKIEESQRTIQSCLKVITKASQIQPTPEDFTRLVPGASRDLHIGSPSIQNNKDFPELSTRTKISSSPKSCVEIKRTPLVKLSQKQRKKLLAEGVVKEESPPVTLRTPWAPLNNNTDCSLIDIIKTTSSHPNRDSEQVRFADIMAEEIQQRDNWSKMKSKSLQLTQIEDKAMEELCIFYNAANIFDERITIERVISANIAKPTWISSHHI